MVEWCEVVFDARAGQRIQKLDDWWASLLGNVSFPFSDEPLTQQSRVQKLVVRMQGSLVVTQHGVETFSTAVMERRTGQGNVPQCCRLEGTDRDRQSVILIASR